MAYPLKLEELIERQARRWEVERRVAVVQPTPPCIGVSRLPGSGGAEVGQRVAEKLDFGCFGADLVNEIARQRGIQRRLVVGLDEHVRSLIERYVTDSFRSGVFHESEYLRHVVRTIATLSERGRAVIIGRGSPFILPPDRSLRVLVVAPRAARIDRIRAERAVSRERATEIVDEATAERREFLLHQFGVDADDPTLYDLVVNTEKLGIDGAVALVAEALLCAFPSEGREAR
jgi:cytidylate kinase